MNITDYDKIEIKFENVSLMLPREVIEKFQVDKIEQLVEAKYHPQDEYDMYIVINRTQAEEVWKKEVLNKFERNSKWMAYRTD